MNLVLRKGSEKRRSQILGNQTCIFDQKTGLLHKNNRTSLFFSWRSAWNPKQPFINGSYGCLGFQVQINIHKPAVFLQDNLLNLASRTPNNDELQALFGKHIPSSEEKLLFARFFSTGFLGGKKFEVVNTHTDTQTRLHSLTGWVVKIWVKIPTLYFLNFQLEVIQKSFFQCTCFSLAEGVVGVGVVGLRRAWDPAAGKLDRSKRNRF